MGVGFVFYNLYITQPILKILILPIYISALI
jgi:hypothetical protein